jgi:signal transduction histidine kinase
MKQEPSNIPPAALAGNETIENLIEHKRRNLEAIFDAVPVGLLLLDENLIVVRVNDAIRKMVGKDYHDIINRAIGHALDCKTIAIEKTSCGHGQYCKKCPLKQNIRKVFETSQPVNGLEFQSQTHFQDRALKPWFSLSVEPVTIEGKKHIVVCLNDITEKKLAEEKLLETMELKSQFISTVSHELRTPLTAISQGLDIVLDGEAGKINEKQKQFLQLSKRNVDRLGLLVNDVLDIQKFESGRMKLDFALNNITETAKEVVHIMSPAAKKANVTLLAEIEHVSPSVFDHNKIIQMLTNLLSNAIKFTPAGGKVSLHIQNQNDEIVITVSDTGLGIPKSDLSKVFQRFYRVKRPGKEISGTGLGLSIVAQIVSFHGGRIMVDSEPDKGTTFTVYLPQKPPTGLNELNNADDDAIEKTVTP